MKPSSPGALRIAVVRFDVAGYVGDVRADLEGPLVTRVLPDPLAAARAGRVVRAHPHRVTTRIVLPGVGAALLKVHEGESGWRAVWGPLRAPRARTEWQAARYLEALGMPVAPALAWGAARGRWRLRMALFLARYVEHRVELPAALEAQPAVHAAALLARVGRLVRSLHDRGFDHADLHPGNLLVGRGPGDVAPLLLTDLHRVRWGRHVGRGARVACLARLLGGLPAGVGPGGRHRVLCAWLGPQAARRERAALAGRVQRAARSLEARRRRSRGRRCLAEGTVFTRELPPGLVGARRRGLAAERLLEVLAAHDEALAARDRRVAKDGAKSAVTRHGDLVVKEARDPDRWSRLRTRWAPLRHKGGYVGAHRLAVVGIATARPQAFVCRGRRSFTLYTELAGLPRLDHHVRHLLASSARGAQRTLLTASADWMARLHGAGVYHGDMKAVNVLVDPRGRTPRFRLIDTDRVRLFARPVDRRRRWKNLAQLAASIPVGVTRTDRLRWFRRYAASWPRTGPRRAFERRAARAVQARLARKVLVVDEPIE